VRYIIENLPKRIKHKLPQLIDAFAVPAPILKIIKNRFERQFISLSSKTDFNEFQSSSFLKNIDLEILFKDLGMHELAMALKGVDRRSLNILFNRLSIDEARGLQQRIRSLVDVPASLLREAKYTVLEMSLVETNSDHLLIDIGLNAFSRAFAKEDLAIFPVMKQKLEPRLGYILKRYIDQHIGANTPEVCTLRKELILKRIKVLMKAGMIDQALSKYFSTDDEISEIKASVEELYSPNKTDGWIRQSSPILTPGTTARTTRPVSSVTFPLILYVDTAERL